MEQTETTIGQPGSQLIQHSARLTSAEIARLWQGSIYYSMLKCVNQYFLNTVEDTALRPLLQFASSIFNTRINRSGEILRGEGHPTPTGFGDEDVSFETPRLFTDLYCYFYYLHMSSLGLVFGATNLAHTIREDVRDFYTESLNSTANFLNAISRIMLEKGIYVRPPIINAVNEPDMVEKQNFLRGFLGERRPLLALEIDQLFTGIRTNLIGGALLTGFQQTTRSKQIRTYMLKGAEIANRHLNILSAVLEKERIMVPGYSGELVTESETIPFSDRLMMQHVVELAGIGIGNYATALATSLRHDLSANYIKLMGEAANYAEGGINIMIANGWLEEPPRPIDRRDIRQGLLH